VSLSFADDFERTYGFAPGEFPPTRVRPLVFIFDGTGPVDDVTYSRNFSDGFCKRLQRETGTPEDQYWRGVPGEKPEWWDVRKWNGLREGCWTRTMLTRTEAAFEMWRQRNLPGMKRKVYLIGYSRGGGSAIAFAHKINELGIDVDALFLFDAVNMTWDLLASSSSDDNSFRIPPNVLALYYAYRDPLYAQELHRERMSATGDLREACDLFLEFSRNDPERSIYDWGNVGLERDPANNGSALDAKRTLFWQTRPFRGTHGAMGGMPWTEEPFSAGLLKLERVQRFIRDDRACADDVHAWMWKWMRIDGLFDHPSEAAQRQPVRPLAPRAIDHLVPIPGPQLKALIPSATAAPVPRRPHR
jgi:hypothetical protein